MMHESMMFSSSSVAYVIRVDKRDVTCAPTKARKSGLAWKKAAEVVSDEVAKQDQQGKTLIHTACNLTLCFHPKVLCIPSSSEAGKQV
jgi:hypothetical protein